MLKGRLSRRPVVMDFDDLTSGTMRKLDLVVKLKKLMPALDVTLFAIPCRLTRDDVHAAKSLGPWLHLGMHGWEHTLGECWTWSDDEAEEKMRRAFDAGIDAKVFRAPKWVIDADTYAAAKRLGWVIADHKDWRILGTGCRTYTYNEPLQNPRFTRTHGHLPNVSGNGIEEAFRSFIFTPETSFMSLFDAADPPLDGVQQ